MAVTGGNWTGGNPPTNLPHPPTPQNLNAVPAVVSPIHGDRVVNKAVGAPAAQAVALFIRGVNVYETYAGRGATGARPAANSVAAGAQYYDTTLGRPIWSNGTAWRDSAGTAV